jgi:hypothetical protein
VRIHAHGAGCVCSSTVYCYRCVCLCSSAQGVHGLLVHHTPDIEPTITFLASIHRLVQSECRTAGVPIVMPETASTQPFDAKIILPNLAEVRSG